MRASVLRVLVCGLGHVGTVTAACLAANGHSVIGADIVSEVQDRFGRGLTSVAESGVADLLANGHARGLIVASKDLTEAAEVDVAMICVGTPGLPHGTLDLQFLENAARGIAGAVRSRPSRLRPLLVVIRSTVLPGTIAGRLLPAISEAAGEGPGPRYEVLMNPEFLREGNAIGDYFAPSRIVVGGASEAAQRLFELYEGIDGPRFETSFEVAEAIKFVDNGFHALKVAFANEIGRFAVGSGIAVSELFELFLADTKLNLSGKYLAPGISFGGPCLPKDVRALVGDMQRLGIDAPILAHVIESNERHSDFLLRRVVARAGDKRRLLLVGLTFKAGSGDLRGSPLLDLAGRLMDAGYDLTIYDPDLGGDAERTLPPPILERVVRALPDDLDCDLMVLGRRPAVLPDAIGSCDIIDLGKF